MGIRRAVAEQHFADTSNLRCRVRNFRTILANHQDINITANLCCRSDSILGCRGQCRLIVLCYYQYAHLDHLGFIS